MKKFFAAIALILLLPAIAFPAARPNSQKGIYFVQGLTGGAQGALDSLDQTGDGDLDITDGTPNRYDLIDGDVAIYTSISGTTGTGSLYVYDADGTDAESSPTVIRPDDYGSSGVWRLVDLTANNVNMGPSSTPTFVFKDSDATAGDNNVTLAVNCTDTGDGTEDCDLTVSVQINGALTAIFTIDADGVINFATLTLQAGGANVLVSGGALGTPASGTGINLTGIPISTGLTGAGTGVLAALAVNIGSAGAPVLYNGDAGTPSDIDLSNATAYPAATTSTSGISELATTSEVNTGTDATRTITPDALAGSTYGTVFVTLRAYEPGTALATGDGKDYWTVPPELNGWNLVSVFGAVYTVSSSGTPTFQIHNLTDTQDMLSTVLTIDASEFNSSTAATPAVINTSYDDIATGDRIRLDVDVAGTSTTGGDVILGFRLP